MWVWCQVYKLGWLGKIRDCQNSQNETELKTFDFQQRFGTIDQVWFTVCVCYVPGMKNTSINTGQCLWQTVLYTWTRSLDMRIRRHRRRQSTDQNDTVPWVTVQQPAQCRTMSITLLFAVCVTRKLESMTKMKSIIFLMFLQATHSIKTKAAVDIGDVFILWLLKSPCSAASRLCHCQWGVEIVGRLQTLSEDKTSWHCGSWSCRWLQAQRSNEVTPHLRRLARQHPWPVQKLSRDHECWYIVDHRHQHTVSFPLHCMMCHVTPNWVLRCKLQTGVLKYICIQEGES